MSNKRYISAIYILNLMFLMIFFSGCATVKISDFYIDPPPGKIPMQVGLYMSPDFRNPVYTYFSSIFPLGEEIVAGMAAGAKKALKETFQEVYIIDRAESTDLSKYGVKAIVVPEIVEPGISIRGGGFGTEGKFEFVCKWTVYATDGKILYMNTFLGTGRDSNFSGATRLNKGMILAIKDNYQKFITHMLSTKWWDGIEK